MEEADELCVVVVAGAAQHVGDRLGVGQALAGSHGNPVVGVDQERDGVGAAGLGSAEDA
jgi:hypothetical protein